MSFWANLRGPKLSFEGGLYLQDHKAVAARRPVQTFSVDGPLHVPLQVGRDLTTAPCVEVGDRVLAGQPLALQAREDALPVHAPTSGTIVRFERVWTAEDGYLPGVVLEPDGEERSVGRPHTWDSESFIHQLAGCGVPAVSPRGSLHARIQAAVDAGVTDLIVNGMETEPYLTNDLRTLVEQPGRLVDATCEIADAIGARRAMIAVPFRHRRVVKRLEGEVLGRYIDLIPLSNRYPQCHPVVLIKTLLDYDIEPDESTLEAGVLVLNASTVCDAADALFDARPRTHALMSINGDAVEQPGSYRVPIGTPMRRLAERIGLTRSVGQAVSGGPLTGVALGRDDAVVTSQTRALLLFSAPHFRDAVPCIRCGCCVEDCPVGLDPAELLELESASECDGVRLDQLKVCIDCGLCSHVCPSQLPLAENIARSRVRFAKRFPLEAAPVA